MNKPKTQFPLKIILSYLVIGTLAVVVSYFMYSEYKTYITTNENSRTEKVIETGSLINDVYETDSFSRIALLTKKQEDFDTYIQKSDSLYQKIENLKNLIPDAYQIQLDSVKSLLVLKRNNIEELRFLKLISDQDNSLDEILREFKNLDKQMGTLYLEDFIKNPSRLGSKERQRYLDYLEYINKKQRADTLIDGSTIASMLAISRDIVLKAKRAKYKNSKELQEKE
ncbi:MAG: hybrid sensor histidine kinase/response regulator, partial [Flavobacteriaceae bacterium]|nr:hybrid sensor histidine kinase/response regulator [Flavobacteriaceae bacterium]